MHLQRESNGGRWLANPAYHRWLLLAVFAGCVALQAVRYGVTRSLVAGDSAWYYSTARSLLIDHDLDLSDEYRHFANDVSPFTGNRRILIEAEADPLTGRISNGFAIGTSLAILPFMAVAHLIWHGDGYGAPYQLAAGIGSALYVFAGILLLYALGRRRFGAERALLASLTVWLATPLVYYMTIEPLMSHAVSMFAVTAFLSLWVVSRDGGWSPLRWALLGLLGGFAAIVRYQDALFCAIPMIDAVASGSVLRKPARAAVSMACFAICIALVVSVQLYVDSYYYGSPWTTGYPALSGFNWLAPAWGRVLFSLHNGLFTFAPVTVLALVGLFGYTRDSRLAGGLLFAAFLVQVYVAAAWVSPDQGATFGNRILLNCTPIFAIGLMRFLERPRPWLCAVLIGLNATLAALYCARVIPDPYIMNGTQHVYELRQRPYAWSFLLAIVYRNPA
ncbi:MAG: ArnT family glycosyltransferase, partial [Gemmatimonadales bacterium]